MGLTRIRAEQISDIDYKQSVRVITLSNITLSGGAPSAVDGINLAAFDRVLVAGQSTGSQNGLYEIQTLGTGANGTWIRTSDGNATGEISAGMIVMVTEGDTYKDTQWKLTTNDPITVGSTALVFEQSSAYAFGIISANATTISADSVGDTLTITPSTGIRVIGNATNDTITLSANLTELIGGTNYQIQYNNNGIFGGAPKFIYDNSTGRVIANAELAATSTSTGTFIVRGGSAVTGNLYVGGIVNSAANITASSFIISGGGVFWSNGSAYGGGGGGGGTPGGNNSEIQYNNLGTFAVAGGLTTNGTNLAVSGNITSRSLAVPTYYTGVSAPSNPIVGD